MVDSGVRPIHNLRVDGNILIDVILNDGTLNVRLIDYRSHHNRELYFNKTEVGIEELSYSDGVKQLIANGFKYCRLIARLLTLHDLSTQAQRIKNLLEENPSLNINMLHEMTDLSEKVIKDSLDELLAKKLITRVGYQRYSIKDQYGHFRPLFDPSKNQQFLT